MKRYILMFLITFFSIGCNSQISEKNNNTVFIDKLNSEDTPKGSWKVNKEFDENGNLIRFDSIYTWSSSDKFKDITRAEKDSLLKSFESKFYKGFSQFRNDGFADFFAQDSLIKNRFFNDSFFQSEFGRDFMDIDEIMQQMLTRQRKFLEKYNRNYIIEPEIDEEIQNRVGI